MRIGIIGMGFMGGVHLNAWHQVETAQVVAVCDANPIVGKAKGNIESGSDELNLEGVKIYTDIADMLSKEPLDAVSITLPTHLHKTISIQCLEAGVHVLCEKPMALNLVDCEAMMAAADAAGKELMVGHCIRFWPEYVWLKNAVEQETYGAVRSAEFERLTYAPAWSGDSWFADTAKSGGIALDLHIHDLDYIHHLFGKPKNIRSQQTSLENGVPGYVQSWFEYDANFCVTVTASWLMPESFGFKMGFTVAFENAAVVFDGQALTVYAADGKIFKPALETGDGYLGEIKHFAERISGPAAQAIITPEQAAESVRMALETIPS